MSEPKPIYRSDGECMAVVYQGHLFDTQGEWVGWLDDADVFNLEGEYVGYISDDGRLLRQRVLPYRKHRRPPTQKPHYQPPQTIPLAPLFAGLSYSTIDVFEENPDIFALVHELRPDAGEKPLPRLVDVDPRLAVQQKLLKVEQELLEQMAHGLIYSYGVAEPPVPVEAMAAGLQPENAQEAETASPLERLWLTRGLIEKLGHSTWAMERGYCGPEGFSPAQIEYAARALLLPRHLILLIPKERRHPADLAQRYIVPEETAVLRLHDVE
jgi:hypothetical protein